MAPPTPPTPDTPTRTAKEMNTLRSKAAASERHRTKLEKQLRRQKSVLLARVGKEKKRRLSLEADVRAMEMQCEVLNEHTLSKEKELEEARRQAKKAMDSVVEEADRRCEQIEVELTAARKKAASLQNKMNASKRRRRSNCDPCCAAKLIGDQLQASGNEMSSDTFSEFVDDVLNIITKRFDAMKFLKREKIMRQMGSNAVETLKCARAGRARNVSRSKTAAHTHQAVIAAVAPTGRSKDVDGWLSTIGINRRAFHDAKKRRNLFIRGDVDHLHKGERKTRKDKLELRHPGLRKAVEKHFETPTEHVKPSPDASQVLKLHVNAQGAPMRHHRDSKKPCNPGCKSEHRIDVTVNRRTLCEDFLKKIGEFLPGPAASQMNEKTFSCNRFAEMIPWNVRRRNKRTCVCTCHLHMILLLSSHRSKALKIHRNCDCECSMCVNGNCKDHPPTKNLDEFAKHVHKICIEGNLDDFNFENLHPRCATGNCRECRVETSPAWRCPREMKHDDDVTPFKEMGKEKRMVTTKSGKKEGTCTIERRVTNKTLAHLKARIAKAHQSKEKFTGFEQAVGFAEHRWVARVQNKAHDEMISAKLPKNHIAITIDFGSNASFLADDQTQGEFFQPVQATVLPSMVHHWKRVADSDERGIGPARPTWRLCASAWDVTSDDLSHDNVFVQAVLRDLVAECEVRLKKENQKLEHVHVWSDGCRSQFKGRQQFAFVSCSESVLGARMEHNFFCSCHGKGGSDAETAFTHSAFRKAQKLERMNSAKDGCDRLLKGKITPKGASKRLDGSTEKKHQLVERTMVFVDAKDVNRKDAVKPKEGGAGGLKGSNSHHAFSSMPGGDGNISMGWVSCVKACSQCLTFNHDSCEHSGINNHCTNRTPGSTQRLNKTMSLRNPLADRKARRERREAGDHVDGVEDDRKRPAMRDRRVRRGWQRSLKKGFTFCVRTTLNDPDGEPGGTLHCRATECERSLLQVFYNVYNPLPDEPGVYKLNEDDTFMCSLGELLPPFGHRLSRVDNEEGTCSIPPHVQEEFSITIASLRSDPVED